MDVEDLINNPAKRHQREDIILKQVNNIEGETLTCNELIDFD